MPLNDSLSANEKPGPASRVLSSVAMILLSIAAILAIILVVVMNQPNAVADPKTTTTASETAEPTASPAKSVLTEGLNTCRLDENLIPHEDGRLDSDFKQRYGNERAGGKDPKGAYLTAVEIGMSQDEGNLAAIATHLGAYDNISGGAALRDENCLSEKGLKVLEQTMKWLQKATVVEGICSPNSWNSGYDEASGVYGVNATAGINGGDLECLLVTFPDGTSYQVLIRCHNFVYKAVAAAHLPEVTTDNDRPEYNYVPPTGGGGGGGGCEYDCGGHEPDKDPLQDPYVQGNAPDGGGPNYDMSEGEFIPAEIMYKQHYPSDDVRVNPTPEVEVVDNTEQTAEVDPQPAPEPEPETPTSAEPEEVCVPKPEFEIYCP